MALLAVVELVLHTWQASTNKCFIKPVPMCAYAARCFLLYVYKGLETSKCMCVPIQLGQERLKNTCTACQMHKPYVVYPVFKVYIYVRTFGCASEAA